MFSGETAANQAAHGGGAALPQHLGPAVLQNNIILNINGPTNINNHHHHGPSSAMSVNQQLYQPTSQNGQAIHGRKIDHTKDIREMQAGRGPVELRLGQDMPSSADDQGQRPILQV